MFPGAGITPSPSLLDSIGAGLDSGWASTGGFLDQYANLQNPLLAGSEMPPILKLLVSSPIAFSSGGTSFGMNLGRGAANAQIMAMVKDFLGRNQLGGRSQANNPVTITPASETRTAAPTSMPFRLDPLRDLPPIRSRVPGAGGGGLGPFGL